MLLTTSTSSRVGFRAAAGQAAPCRPTATFHQRHVAHLRDVRARASSSDAGFNYNIHGRHVDVTPELEDYVKDRFSKTLEKLYAADYLEAEGGVKEVDVRLMNTKADISVKPARTNKAMHDTYLRMGELKAEGTGGNVYESFDRAAETLDRKLHKWSKASPQRKDMRNIGQGYRPSARQPGGSKHS